MYTEIGITEKELTMNKDFLFSLLETDSVSGNEEKIEKKIYAFAKDFADEVSVDELSNVTAAINTESSFRVLMTGHADEIGLMISAVTESGMLRVTSIGGIYPTTYPGHKVRVHTANGTVYGAVLNTRDLAKKEGLKASDFYIDIGASNKEEALGAVALGDTVTFDTDVRELLGTRFTARAVDDRVGAFIVTEALKAAKEKGAKVGAYAAATTGEETTMNGAYFTASRVKPNIAIAVDVTYATDYPGCDIADTGDVRLGAGPVLCNNPSVHKRVNKLLAEAAAKAGVAVQYEAANGRTGTDGDVMHKTGDGVPFALVSIPLRYMHCPCETCDLRDVEGAVKLLAEFICILDDTTDLRPF